MTNTHDVKIIEELIIIAIKGKELMIEEIAAAVKINRITAAKYLAVLEAKGIVKYRPVGKAKLFSEVNP